MAAIKLLYASERDRRGVPFLIRSMRPGLENGTHWPVILFPLVATIVVAFVMLVLGRPQTWREMLFGASTFSPARCLLCITFFSAIPLAVLIWALRKGAPTGEDLWRHRRNRRRRPWCSRLRVACMSDTILSLPSGMAPR